MWREKYEADLRHKTPGLSAQSQANELRELEIEVRRLHLQRQQRLAAVEENDMVERGKVEREFAALVSVTRERLLRVAAMIEPMLPADVAVEVRIEIEKQVKRQLVASLNQNGRRT